jgi:hypothetical protein
MKERAMAETIIVGFIAVVGAGVLICIVWALYECNRLEREIMKEAMDNPAKREAASALWCAPREWRGQR